jgi:hypothetical protein
MLYMFQAVFPPIIGSWKLYTQHLVGDLALSANSPTLAVAAKKIDIYEMLCVQFWAPDDGRKNHLKHVEHWQQ